MQGLVDSSIFPPLPSPLSLTATWTCQGACWLTRCTLSRAGLWGQRERGTKCRLLEIMSWRNCSHMQLFGQRCLLIFLILHKARLRGFSLQQVHRLDGHVESSPVRRTQTLISHSLSKGIPLRCTCMWMSPAAQLTLHLVATVCLTLQLPNTSHDSFSRPLLDLL